jgi:hypothetical protein
MAMGRAVGTTPVQLVAGVDKFPAVDVDRLRDKLRSDGAGVESPPKT